MRIGHVPNVVALANILGCRVFTLSLSYLGLSLGATYKNQVVWNTVLEHTKKRLAGWKRLYLSKALSHVD